MPDLHTRIVIRRPSDKVEIIGRHGQHDPHKMAKTFEQMGLGTVLAVRHEMSQPVLPNQQPSKTKPVQRRHMTLAIHQMSK
jgi:phosphoribosylaminoimidazole (AIR) synthetase